MTTDTHTTILQTARRLFVQQGFTATSIRQLAQEVGIGKATIYHHFADKQAIMLALLDDELDVDEDVLAALATEPDPRKRIETAVTTSFTLFKKSAALVQIARREVPAGRERVNASFHTYWDSHTALVAAAIKQGQAAGIFRDVDPAQAAQMLVAMIFGLVSSVVALERDNPMIEEETAVLLDIFYRGIEA